MTTRILLATHNAHKISEFQSLLAPLGLTVVGADDVRLPEAVEVGTTFAENALIKARAGFAHTGLPTLADDSGLCITALQGQPGIYSARFAAEHGGFPAVFDTVFDLLKDTSDRSAAFVCSLALITGPDTADEHVFTGRMPGRIDHRATGTHTFGYDPIFIPDGFDVSCGVLDPDIKNRISHRARATEQLIAFLKSRPQD